MTTTSMQFGQSTIDVVLNEGQQPAKLTTDSNGNTVGIIDPTAGDTILTPKGEIALYSPDDYVDGVAQGGGQAVASATVNSNALGTILTWSALLFDTTNNGAGGAWSNANPSRIVIPAGVTKANFNASILFTANATGARMLRLTTGATPTHVSNVLIPVSHAVAAQTLALNTGWINVTAGDYYEVRVVQDSGSTLTTIFGTTANKGGSTYFRAAFK